MSTKADRLVFQGLFSRNWYGWVLKRTFDIIASALVLALISPILGFIALAIRRDTPGPALFSGARSGRGGKTFKILKFRTMYETPESYKGPKVTAHDDPRITPLGRWLRDTKLNELPQFWNVLKGDMSLVGPRPEDPSITRTWPDKIREEILSVRPGITSPASIQYHNEEALFSYGGVLSKYVQEVGPDKMRLDQLYIHYLSFWLDLDILLWTMLIFVPRISSRTLPEELLFVGPFTRLVRRYLNWFTIDLLVTLAAIGFTGLIWRAFEPLNVGLFRAAVIALGFALLFSLTGVILGVNRIAWSKSTFADAYELFPAWLAAFTIVFLFNWQMTLFPWPLVIAASLVALGGFVLVRYRSRLITALLVSTFRHIGHVQAVRERVLIVGSGRTAEHIAWLIDHPTYSRTFQVVGIVDDDLLDKGMRIYGANVVGTCQDLPQLVKRHNVGLVLLADHRLNYKKYCFITEVCDNLQARIMVVPDIFGSLNNLPGAMTNFMFKEEESRVESEFRCQRCMTRPFGSKIENEQGETMKC